MSEPENFVARWSRRKREAAQDADASKAAAAPSPTTKSAHPGEGLRQQRDTALAPGDAPQLPEAAFDPTKLPPIETITAESDIRPFLAPGVPAELTRAALRRAWAADPKIRDFVGLSENSWDFNSPAAIPGFGPLEMTDELRAQLAQMVGRSFAGETTERVASPEHPEQTPSSEAPVQSAGAADEVPKREVQGSVAEPPRKGDGDRSPRGGAASLPQRNRADVAPQREAENPDNDQLIAKRLHGRALPK